MGNEDPVPRCPLGFGGKQSSRGVCPLGFGSRGKGSVETLSSLPRMPLPVLARHGGGKGTGGVRLLSVKGVVFDVTSNEKFGMDGILGYLPGHDASRLLGLADEAKHTVSHTLLDTDLSEFSYDEHRRLEARFLGMLETCPAVAVLADEDYERIFGAPFCRSLSQSTEKEPISDKTQSPSAELHKYVERGESESLAALLAGGNISKELIDKPCSRTGMTPLLKAVEGGFEDAVRRLLEAGADPLSEAQLYDGDNALQLARRLGEREAIERKLEEWLGDLGGPPAKTSA